MSRSRVWRILTLTVVVAALFVQAGCEDDDDQSGTATVSGNIRSFAAPEKIEAAAARAKLALGGIMVELRKLNSDYRVTATSSSGGSFEFTNVPAGDFELVLTGGGLTGKLTITVTEGATVELVDIIVKSDGTTRQGPVIKTERAAPETAAATTYTSGSEGSAAPSIFLDQSQTSGAGGARRTGHGLAQTFTVGAVGGTIAKVEVDISIQGTVTNNISLAIHAVDESGLPARDVLARATIPAASVGAGWEIFTLSTPPTVNAGTQYAIVITSRPTGESENYYTWSYAELDPYQLGSSYYRLRGWRPEAKFDHTFKVYLQE